MHIPKRLRFSDIEYLFSFNSNFIFHILLPIGKVIFSGTINEFRSNSDVHYIRDEYVHDVNMEVHTHGGKEYHNFEIWLNGDGDEPHAFDDFVKKDLLVVDILKYLKDDQLVKIFSYHEGGEEWMRWEEADGPVKDLINCNLKHIIPIYTEKVVEVRSAINKNGESVLEIIVESDDD